MPGWLHKTNHAISPDGKAAIYSSNNENNVISVSTWVNTTMGSGGAGVFNFKSLDKTEVGLIWISDNIAQIEYPVDSEIIRQEYSTYFAGRTIQFKYKQRN